jgi:hypothetical protein
MPQSTRKKKIFCQQSVTDSIERQYYFAQTVVMPVAALVFPDAGEIEGPAYLPTCDRIPPGGFTEDHYFPTVFCTRADAEGLFRRVLGSDHQKELDGIQSAIEQQANRSTRTLPA